jgi:hypothetical protein
MDFLYLLNLSGRKKPSLSRRYFGGHEYSVKLGFSPGLLSRYDFFEESLSLPLDPRSIISMQNGPLLVWSKRLLSCIIFLCGPMVRARI